jgi:hypothetical protein
MKRIDRLILFRRIYRLLSSARHHLPNRHLLPIVPFGPAAKDSNGNGNSRALLRTAACVLLAATGFPVQRFNCLLRSGDQFAFVDGSLVFDQIEPAFLSVPVSGCPLFELAFLPSERLARFWHCRQ